MKANVLLVIVALSTVQSYKIRVTRKHYKHKTNRTAAVGERTALGQEPSLDNAHSAEVHQYDHHYYNEAPVEAPKIISAPHINRVVADLCKDTDKDILVVWEAVAKNLGLDKGYPVQHRGELRKLTTIIETFVALSKENDFKQMPVHQILQTIDNNLELSTDQNDISQEEIEGLSHPNYELHTDSSIADNEASYLDETGRRGVPLSFYVPNSPHVHNLNEIISEPTNVINSDEVETELQLEPTIATHVIESVSSEIPIGHEHMYNNIPATSTYLNSDDLITIIPSKESVNDDISPETTDILTATSSYPENGFHHFHIGMQPIHPLDNSLEPIYTDTILDNHQNEHDLKKTHPNVYNAMIEDILLHQIYDNQATGLNARDSAENDVSTTINSIVPDESTDLDQVSLPLITDNSEAESHTEIPAPHLDSKTNVLVTHSHLENPIENAPVEYDSNGDLITVLHLPHPGDGSEAQRSERRLLKIQERLPLSRDTPSPYYSIQGPIPFFRSPNYFSTHHIVLNQPHNRILPYNIISSQLNRKPVDYDDYFDVTRKNLDSVESSDVKGSQLHNYPNLSYAVDARHRNLRVETSQGNSQTVSHDVDTNHNVIPRIIPYNVIVEPRPKNHNSVPNAVDKSRTNFHLIAPYVVNKKERNPDDYDDDTSQINIYPIDDVNTNGINLDTSVNDTNQNKIEKKNIKLVLKNHPAENKMNLYRRNHLDSIVFSILPELLSHYSDCQHDVGPILFNLLSEFVTTLETNACHRPELK